MVKVKHEIKPGGHSFRTVLGIFGRLHTNRLRQLGVTDSPP
jgi:hypothetical protein